MRQDLHGVKRTLPIGASVQAATSIKQVGLAQQAQPVGCLMSSLFRIEIIRLGRRLPPGILPLRGLFSKNQFQGKLEL